MPTSIVIPAAGTDKELWRLSLVLESIVYQSVRPAEVVVVRADEDGDWVKDICESFKSVLPITYSFLPPSTKCFRAGEARNQGVKVLSKEVDRLLFIDDDCVLSPDTVAVHTDVNPRIILAGTRNHVDPEELSSRTLPAVYSSIYTLDNRLAHPENWGSYDSCYTCHLSISSAVFQRIGGFWEELTIGEDRDLCMRAMRAMCQVTFLPRDAVYHIDHEIRRPMGPQDLPEGAKLVEDSIKLPGYLRDSPL